MFLYLNDPIGGDFAFQDQKRLALVHPSPGKLVMMTSGPENVHGVTQLRGGERYAMGLVR